ncbi:MAG: DUF1624 domain-containing protein [Planctomycetaceae bacterium]|nr:DUF1624 domain-containing protein [Planctomycetaceae bacterium]
MADDRSREPFNKGKPMPGGNPPPLGSEKKPLPPIPKVITPIPLKKPDPPPVKAAAPAPRPGENRPPAARPQPRNPGRLASLDAYRGFIMLMLAASGFGIGQFVEIDASSPVWKIADYSIWQQIGFHFEHPEWRSNFLPKFLESTPAGQRDTELVRFAVSFWDLIQPAFMFMVGVAMPLSNARRWSEGQSAGWRYLHALWRAVALVLLGVFLYSQGSAHTNWIFPNVLAQIGLGYFFAYLLLPLKSWVQIGVLAAILGAYWGLFKIDPPPAEYDYAAVEASADRGEVYEGKFAAWSKNANFAHNFDRRFLNMLRTLSDEDMKTHGIPLDARSWAPAPVRTILFANSEPFLKNSGGYLTLNFIPSIGTTLLGILCGQLLISTAGKGKKLLLLLVGGAVCLALGLVMGEFACPIVKRIWTPSWVLFSGGYVIWMLALFYFVFDVLPLKLLAFPLAVLGVNSLAVYLMGELLRGWTREKVVQIHLSGLLETIFGAEKLQADMFGPIIYPTTVVLVFWLVCLWMYRSKVLVRL